MFRMLIKEVATLHGVTGTVVAGPILDGDCQVGDVLVLRGARHDHEGRCESVQLVNWGQGRADWVSIEVSGVSPAEACEATDAFTVER